VIRRQVAVDLRSLARSRQLVPRSIGTLSRVRRQPTVVGFCHVLIGSSSACCRLASPLGRVRLVGAQDRPALLAPDNRPRQLSRRYRAQPRNGQVQSLRLALLLLQAHLRVLLDERQRRATKRGPILRV